MYSHASLGTPPSSISSSRSRTVAAEPARPAAATAILNSAVDCSAPSAARAAAYDAASSLVLRPCSNAPRVAGMGGLAWSPPRPCGRDGRCGAARCSLIGLIRTVHPSEALG